jgi:hypothetical protein
VNVSRTLAGVLGAAMALLPIVPPEHVHETEEQGRIHVVVHRHAQLHDILEHHADDYQQVEDDDGPALALDSTFHLPAPTVLGSPARTVGELIDPPAPRRIDRSFADIELQIHGPPRAPTPLRAPPFSPAT